MPYRATRQQSRRCREQTDPGSSSATLPRYTTNIVEQPPDPAWTGSQVERIPGSHDYEAAMETHKSSGGGDARHLRKTSLRKLASASALHLVTQLRALRLGAGQSARRHQQMVHPRQLRGTEKIQARTMLRSESEPPQALARQTPRRNQCRRASRDVGTR